MLTHRMERSKIVMSEYLLISHFIPSFILGKITIITTKEIRVLFFQNGLSVLPV